MNCLAIELHHNTCVRYGASIVELIANPARYDGKPVRVIGYIHWEFWEDPLYLHDGDAIYLHQEDHEKSLFSNGLWVRLPRGAKPGECQNRYVVIEGTFRAENRGHMDLWSGAILDITSCAPWPRTEPPN